MVTVCLLPFDLQLKNSNKLVYHTFSIQISIFRLWWWQGNKKENTKKTPGRQLVWSLVTALLLQPKQTETKQI